MKIENKEQTILGLLANFGHDRSAHGRTGAKNVRTHYQFRGRVHIVLYIACLSQPRSNIIISIYKEHGTGCYNYLAYYNVSPQK